MTETEKRQRLIKEITEIIKTRAPFCDTMSEAEFLRVIAEQSVMTSLGPLRAFSMDQMQRLIRNRLML
jgi:hypothetical protein